MIAPSDGYKSDYLPVHSGPPSKRFSRKAIFLLRLGKHPWPNSNFRHTSSSHCNMNETNKGGAAFISSIGLAFIGGYADASKCGEQRFVSYFGSTFGSRCFSQWNSLESNTDSLRSSPITGFFASDHNVHRGSASSECFSALTCRGKPGVVHCVHVSRPGI